MQFKHAVLAAGWLSFSPVQPASACRAKQASGAGKHTLPVALSFGSTDFATPSAQPTQPEVFSATPEQKATAIQAVVPNQATSEMPSTLSSQPSATEIPTATPTLPVTPTYTILRGEVIERSNCRYGPGAPYFYKYGLVVGCNLEIIGRNDLGTWILIRDWRK